MKYSIFCLTFLFVLKNVHVSKRTQGIKHLIIQYKLIINVCINVQFARKYY